MTTAANPYAVQTVRCAGPGCMHERKASNHWFLISLEDCSAEEGIAIFAFTCLPYTQAMTLREGERPVCGSGCAQKIFEQYLNNTTERL